MTDVDGPTDAAATVDGIEQLEAVHVLDSCVVCAGREGLEVGEPLRVFARVDEGDQFNWAAV